jgi:hypothetical protein
MKQELSTVALDLAKKVFHLVGADTTGKLLWRKPDSPGFRGKSPSR